MRTVVMRPPSSMRIEYGSNIVQEQHKHGATRISGSFDTQNATDSGENAIVELVKDTDLRPFSLVVRTLSVESLYALLQALCSGG